MSQAEKLIDTYLEEQEKYPHLKGFAGTPMPKATSKHGNPHTTFDSTGKASTQKSDPTGESVVDRYLSGDLSVEDMMALEGDLDPDNPLYQGKPALQTTPSQTRQGPTGRKTPENRGIGKGPVGQMS
ncbi:MAG: hypothetical protein MJA83_16675 [Gammaproteobacteria bacterium]|nr:hypothetical protein [Gammaproteobacteria bacterium]